MIHETITLGNFTEATLTSICFSNPKHLNFSPRRAVIVCPGGGYRALSPREAEPIAAQFLAAGFATFILHYGIGENASDYRPLKQVALAIRHVRENAEKYFVDPDYVFVCGFSAGGHLAASAGILWNSPVLDEIAAGAPRDIVRPTGMILSYPVISSGEWGHKGSFLRLCGKEDATEEELNAFSLEKHVTADTVPAFIWHTFKDQAVPVQNSLMLADAMAKATVPFELHVFPQGPHGLALCNELTSTGKPTFIEPHAAPWMELAIRWATDFTL